MDKQRIVILGGSAGIGLATAQAAARAGAEVIIGSSSQARVTAALATLPASATGHAVDLRSAASIGALFERIGAFDHLVYTAGETLLTGPLGELDLAAAHAFFEVRYFGALTSAKLAVPHLRAGGSILFTSGLASQRPMAGWAIGASICAAMEGLTRALAVELAPLRVNLVRPGFVETDLWSNIPAAARADMYREAAARIPVKHVGKPEEIAEAYLYLLRATYSTGQIVTVDGGMGLV